MIPQMGRKNSLIMNYYHFRIRAIVCLFTFFELTISMNPLNEFTNNQTCSKLNSQCLDAAA